MYHAIHAFGLAELLKNGVVSNVDDEHYWNLIDNTYIDDVRMPPYVLSHMLINLQGPRGHDGRPAFLLRQ